MLLLCVSLGPRGTHHTECGLLCHTAQRSHQTWCVRSSMMSATYKCLNLILSWFSYPKLILSVWCSQSSKLIFWNLAFRLVQSNPTQFLGWPNRIDSIFSLSWALRVQNQVRLALKWIRIQVQLNKTKRTQFWVKSAWIGLRVRTLGWVGWVHLASLIYDFNVWCTLFCSRTSYGHFMTISGHFYTNHINIF